MSGSEIGGGVSDQAKPLLAVTGSQRPYLFDLPQLLSLPEGFEFRFRYRHTWVDPAIVRQLVDGETNLAGREAIILFHSQMSRRIVPIRRGTIIGLEELGPMILLRFRVGPFARIKLDLSRYTGPSPGEKMPGAEASLAATALLERAKALLGSVEQDDSFDLSQPLPRGSYLREAAKPSDPGDWDPGDAAAAWARMIAVLNEDHCLLGVPFFFLLGFRTETGTTVKPSVVENRFSFGREAIHGFGLQEFERYRMRVIEWCERPRTAPEPRVRLKCQFQEAHLALEGASDLVVGRYDVVEFTFSARQPGYSEVGLSADRVDMDDKKQVIKEDDPEAATGPSESPAWADWPTIFAARVPVVVKLKPWKFIGVTIASAVGLSLYIWLAPEIGSTHPAWQRPLELVGIAILFFGWSRLRGHVDRFLKLSGGLDRFRGAPKEH